MSAININYTVTNNVEEATHWLAYHDDKSIIKDKITPWKLYKLELIQEKLTNMFGVYIEDEDYYCRDNNGKLGMTYFVHKGDFVIVEGEN